MKTLGHKQLLNNNNKNKIRRQHDGHAITDFRNRKPDLAISEQAISRAENKATPTSLVEINKGIDPTSYFFE
ncbi:hypothetical protein [Photorhabdus heterorhabditis]|uniref:hypothetical protein n=1 Tax=Photorhabdus heterorhabditis TaxID=880156 RepID=UPI001562A50D|nr:hypothetical protein [Photorhabdus heterorhabditis]NRN29478.1 hypothetical protein [Photorhabdus heterorhabditis subsp. aluminescens]